MLRWVTGTRRGSVLLTIGASAVAVAGVLSASGGVSRAAPAGTGTGTGVKIAARSTALGLVVVAGKAEHTAYLRVSHTSCGPRCQKVWHPVKSSRKPAAGSGIRAKHLGRTKTHQVTYYGHPLYYYSHDHKAGQTRGQGLSSYKGHWWVVGTDGRTGTGSTVGVNSTADGKVVAGMHGRTLYTLSSDTATRSTCTSSGGCSNLWPPLTTVGKPHAGTGVKSSLLGTLTRHDGSHQVSYNGHPLYYFSGDSAAGDDNGECYAQVPGTWYIVGPAGHEITDGSGCGSGGTTSGPPTSSGPPPVLCNDTSADATISTATVGNLGEVLVDGNGCTLYLFHGDTQSGTSSACTGACPGAWPPVMTTDAPTAGGDVQSGLLGTITRSAGDGVAGTQVTYNGWPLYRYGADTHPGSATGEGRLAYMHYWYALQSTGVEKCSAACHDN
jgi:predicted lipoprotein with Yx(FWY)xxD motif